MIVKIEQRLQDPQRFFLIPADEALTLGFPTLMGMLTQNLIPGIIASVVFWVAWKKLKGDGGLERFAALCYWYLPAELQAFPSFPDSAQTRWEA